MSFKLTNLIPANPSAARGEATKLSANGSKIVYTNGKTVIIRDISNASPVIAYSEHVHNATVARISPSGYYCASADASGAVRIWDIVGEDRALKAEYKVISGKISDLAWDGESKRIVAVGNGREKFAHAFMMDSGSSTGEITGHSKVINAVSIRHQRPFKAVTASDDNSIIFHSGVPFKYEKTIKTHTQFVQDVRYAPSGDHFASVGSDSKLFFYDGKTGDLIGEVTDQPHKGTIYAATWSPDNKSLATASADRTVKLWDVEARKALTTWTLGEGVSYQQTGTVWAGTDDIVSVSVAGDLNVFDRRVGDKPSRVLFGAQKAVTSLTSPKKSSGDDTTFFAGTADGRVLAYNESTASVVPVPGTGHATLISALASSSSGNNKIYSVGFDDRIREIEGGAYTPASTSLGAQPKSLAVAQDGTVFVAEISGVEAIRDNQKLFTLATPSPLHSIVAHGDTVAVGSEDSKVRLYRWDGAKLTDTGKLLEANRSAVTALAFSPDGSILVAGDSAGKVIPYTLSTLSALTTRWSGHSGRIHALAFTADGRHCASASLDTHVYIWSVTNPAKNVALKNVLPGGANAIAWQGESRLVGAGADGSVRVWEVTFHS